MAHLDIFKESAFDMANLTEAINKVPYMPSMIRNMNIFTPRPIRTTVATVEDRQGTLALVATAGRGSMGDVRSRPRRTLRSFNVPHVPYFQTLLADDVQNVRAFGSETELELVQDVVNDNLIEMRKDHDATLEFQRVGALKGQVLDADGTTVIYNYFTEFGESQTNLTFDHTTDATDAKLYSSLVIRTLSDALGGTPFSKVVAVCGDRFFDALTIHPTVVAGYERWQSSMFFRTIQIGPEYNADMMGFDFGNITWVNYRGKVGDVQFVADDECHYAVSGVPGLYLEVISPADMMQTVNTRGLPFYASQELLPHNKGVELHTQHNILYLPTRPKALIKGTATNIPAIVPAFNFDEYAQYISQISHTARPGDKIVIPEEDTPKSRISTQTS